jgi:RNA polymerase sigma-70 factor, ECF subfamily
MEQTLAVWQGANAVYEAGPLLTFEQLYVREYPGLIAVAWALSGLREDGEDLVHDTMVQALARWKHVGALERPGGWCHHALVNRCRSLWRRRRTEAAFVAHERGRVASSPGPSEEAVAFWTAVRTLPIRQRSVVALHYAGDLTSAEIAHVLDMPEGTVRSDLTRSRTVLAGLMAVRDV